MEKKGISLKTRTEKKCEELVESMVIWLYVAVERVIGEEARAKFSGRQRLSGG